MSREGVHQEDRAGPDHPGYSPPGVCGRRCFGQTLPSQSELSAFGRAHRNRVSWCIRVCHRLQVCWPWCQSAMVPSGGCSSYCLHSSPPGWISSLRSFQFLQANLTESDRETLYLVQRAVCFPECSQVGSSIASARCSVRPGPRFRDRDTKAGRTLMEQGDAI